MNMVVGRVLQYLTPFASFVLQRSYHFVAAVAQCCALAARRRAEVTVEGQTWTFTKEEDPTKARTACGPGRQSMAMDRASAALSVSRRPGSRPAQVLAPYLGKLVRWLAPNQSAVHKGQPICEVEVMKLLVPLKVPGVLEPCLPGLPSWPSSRQGGCGANAGRPALVPLARGRSRGDLAGGLGAGSRRARDARQGGRAGPSRGAGLGRRASRGA